jgi:L-ascorbate metabolism protein UlaG (beta-lactamase superfamily)
LHNFAVQNNPAVMKFTYYGHACFAVETGGQTLLFDPFISGNELAKHIDISSIKADYILLSHGHGDHVADLAQIAQQTGALVIGAYEVTEWAQKNGVERAHPMNFGSATFGFGKLHFVPAWHSSTLPDGTPGGNPGGFVICGIEGNFYYSGDTGLMMDMQLIPRFGKLSFAVMPIGGNFTMDADDAVIAADFVKCDKVIGVHFDTFGYIKINHEQAHTTFTAASKELILPSIGQSFDI